MIPISNNVQIQDHEVVLQAIKSSGPGGQNVNKVATAIHLHFDFKRSSLPNFYKNRLMIYKDHHITQDGCIVIKVQKHRTQEANREEAIQMLVAIIRKAIIVPKKRKATKPSKSSQRKRLDKKTKHSKLKASRNKRIDY
ncbi:MAG: aminoacyl-tRNA hydrolase [Lentisphaeria bacterium]|nr:aminoacyl-tRNA hydrolase [Lentisphaeria bacterium]